MGIIRLFFFSIREHNSVEWFEFVVQMFLYDLRLGALAVRFVAHDLLRLVLHMLLLRFFCSNRGIGNCSGLIH